MNDDKIERPRAMAVNAVGVLLALSTVGAVGVIAHNRNVDASRESNARAQQAHKGLRVRTATAQAAPAERKIELQAEGRPFASVTLYAKVSGYVKRINVDRGDRVKANDVVAVITSPEVDRQYDAAKAEARYKLANAQRVRALVGPGLVSAADAEAQAGQADIAAAQLSALREQRSYQVVRAPFAGTVTDRFADAGALVQAATGTQNGALPLVTISTPERLRIRAYVPQRDAAYVRVNDAAVVSLSERADVKIEGRVARRGDELDARTRMMLVEIDVDNRDRRIVPGSFVNLRLTIARPAAVQIPVEALVVRAKKPFVFVLDGEVAHQRPVVIGDNDGTNVCLEAGLAVGEVVALNAGSELTDGDRVQRIAPVAEHHAKGP